MSNYKSSIRLKAAKILYRIYRSDAFADVLVNHAAKDRSLSLSDKGLLSELVYGVLRWKGWLDYLLGQSYHGQWKKCPEKIRIILEIGLYQLLYLNRIPSYAVLNESVEMTRQWVHPRWSGLVNAILRRLDRHLSDIPVPMIQDDPVKAIAALYSHPEWLVSQWISEFGTSRTIAMCRANNEKAPLVLRVNTIRDNPEDILEKLKEIGYDAVKGRYLGEYIRISHASGIFDTELFKEGHITVQDESAGLVGRLLDPKPGELILDMAAAPGGKTGHVCELSDRKAVIMAIDLHWSRIRYLKETLKRLHHMNVFIVHADSLQIPGKVFDKILLDAPCSGIGAIRKRAELKWRIQPKQIETLIRIQKSLLEQAATCIRSGGVIIYSTCTTNEAENQAMIQWFLQTHQKFQIDSADRWVSRTVVNQSGCIETWPDIHDVDGSFAVRLKHRS